MAPLRVLLSGPFRRARTGGVKTHVERLRVALTGLGVVVTTIDPRTWEALSFPKRAASADVVHIHSSSGWLACLYAAIALIFRKRVLVTIHGNIGDFPAASRFGFLVAAHLGAELLVLNDVSAAFVMGQGLSSQKISAFLPPTDIEDEAKSADTARLMNIIERISREFKSIFITYTYDGNLGENDIYGIEDLFVFFSSRPHLALVVLSCANAAFLQNELVSRNVFVFEGDVLVTKVAGKTSGVIRNSLTDGDSILVREGLYSGVPVLATDVVSRPPGVFLYRWGDHDSLDDAIRMASEAPARPPSSWEPSDLRTLYWPPERPAG